MNDIVVRAYRTLGLPPNAPLEDVKRTYAALVEREDSSRDNWERLNRIDWAYRTLVHHLEKGTNREAPESPSSPEENTPASGSIPIRVMSLRNLLFPPQEKVNPLHFWCRLIFFVILVFWGIRFITAPIEGDYIGRSFMHLINLPFHEAGHVIFSFFGSFMHVLGGSLMQVLIPVICVAAFLKKGDAFGASVALWWTGQSFIDMAPYIYDARAGKLLLLGGVTGREAPDYHDWHNILERLGILHYDHALAYLSKYKGVILILSAFAWATVTLLRQYRNLDKT